jgi:hypothetical protein
MAEHASVLEPEESAIARHQLGKHASVTTNQHATIEEMLETVLSVVCPKAT